MAFGLHGAGLRLPCRGGILRLLCSGPEPSVCGTGSHYPMHPKMRLAHHRNSDFFNGESFRSIFSMSILKASGGSAPDSNFTSPVSLSNRILVGVAEIPILIPSSMSSCTLDANLSLSMHFLNCFLFKPISLARGTN